MRWRGRVACALPIAAAWLSLAGTVSAHARLEGGSPAPGSVVANSPVAIELRFNEPVEPVAVRLVDAAGRDRLSDLPALAIDDIVRIELTTPLEAGSYLLSYRVISGDAHVIASAYGFAIGKGPGLPDATPVAIEGPADTAVRVLRTAYMLVLLAAAGIALFVLLLRPALDLRAPLLRVEVLLAAAGFLLAPLYGIAAGSSMLGVHDSTVVGAALAIADTSLGRSLLVAAAGFGVLGIAARAGGTTGLLAAGVVLVIVSRTLTGHPASRDPGWLLQSSMALHVACASFWLGSLWPLDRATAGLDARATAELLERFSAVAMVAVLVLAFAGVLMALLHLSAPAALGRTVYGRLLILKMLGFAVLIGLASLNKLRLTLEVGRGDARAARRLRTSLRVEAAVMVAVVVLSTLLASTPPDEPLAASAPAAAAWSPTSVEVTSDSGYQLSITRLPAALSSVLLALRSPDGAIVAAVGLDVRASLPAVGVTGVELVAEATDDGRYVVGLAPLTVPGDWQFEIDAYVTDFDKERFDVQLRHVQGQ